MVDCFLCLGKCFVTGVASSYDTTFDEARLGSFFEPREYEYLMRTINEALHRCWPCAFVLWAGYLLAPFTLGLSFFLPNLCIKDAKGALITAIARQNRIKLGDRGLKMSYRQGCLSSWLEIEIVKVKEETVEDASES